MMKKFISIILTVSMFTLLVSGCGKSKEEERQRTKVSTSTEETKESTMEEADNNNYVGVYYDEESYINDGFFYCIVLRDNGDALMSIQDIAVGTWSTNDVIDLPDWQCMYDFSIIDDGLYIDEWDVVYKRAPEDIIPEYIMNYVTDGTFPELVYQDIEETHFSGLYENDEAEINITYTDDGYMVNMDLSGVGFYTGRGDILGHQLFIYIDGENDFARAVFYKNGSSYELMITESVDSNLEAFNIYEGLMPTEASYDMPGEPVRETIDINPQNSDNFEYDNGRYIIYEPSYEDGEERNSYVFDEDTVICQGLPCYDYGCDSLDWINRYLSNPVTDEYDETNPYSMSGIGMGDVWTVVVQDGHIEIVTFIGWWD